MRGVDLWGFLPTGKVGMKFGKLWRGHSPVLGDPGLQSSRRHWLCRKEDHTDVEFPHVPGESCAAKLPTIDLPVHASETHLRNARWRRPDLCSYSSNTLSFRGPGRRCFEVGWSLRGLVRDSQVPPHEDDGQVFKPIMMLLWY